MPNAHSVPLMRFWIYLNVAHSDSFSFFLSLSLSLSLSFSPFLFLSLYVSLHLSLNIFIVLSLFLSVSTSFNLSRSILSICLSFFPSSFSLLSFWLTYSLSPVVVLFHSLFQYLQAASFSLSYNPNNS